MGSDIPSPERTTKASTFLAIDPNNAARIARFLHRIAADEINTPRRKSYFNFPFHLTGEKLLEISDVTSAALTRGEPHDAPVELVAEVRFADLSSIRYNNFSELLEYAGNNRLDPERLTLLWRKARILDAGNAASSQVDIQFITEQQLINERSRTQAEAYVTLSVSGSDRSWVFGAFDSIVPHIEDTRLPRLPYDLLYIFRNTVVLYFLSVTLGYLALSFVESVLLSHVIELAYEPIATKMTKIAAASSVPDKLDLLAEALFTPPEIPRWPAGGIAAVTGILAGLCSFKLLPRLSPRSFVAIGLARKRAAEYYNLFRVLAGGVLLTIVLGVLSSILFDAIKYAIYNR